MTVYKITFTIVLTFLVCGCKSQSLDLALNTEYGLFKFSNHDTEVVEDLVKTCRYELQRISDELKLKTDRNLIIEIYPDQSSYDKNIMDPHLKGSPAISGNGKIQLVSPVSRIKIDTISYLSRLIFVIHEYVHVMLDQLPVEPPTWLDEGLACYYGSYGFYHSVVKSHIGEMTFYPTMEQLRDHYNEIPAADVYSFLMVEYLIKSGRFDKIDRIIMEPDSLQVVRADWIAFIKTNY